jgi:hypothetical protein
MREDFQCLLPNGAQNRSESGEGEDRKKPAAAGNHLLRSHIAEDYNTATPIRWPFRLRRKSAPY